MSTGGEENAGDAAGAQTTDGGVAHFDIDASVVFQLGEHLITDVIQALVELVKNAYDADASYAKITIMTDASPPLGSAFPDAHGYIEIEDDGVGMSRDDITSGWLVISHSAKRALKAQGASTERNARTPLGDKGLGRLGAQRLGDNIEITTAHTSARSENSDVPRTEEAETSFAKKPEENVVRFSWRDFVGARRLRDVPVALHVNVPPTRERGTRILITGLRNPEMWRGDSARKSLQKGLSQLISPYEGVHGFRVLVSVNGASVDLARVSAAVRRTSQVRYQLAYHAGRLTVTGMARLTFFRPPAGKELRLRFRDEVEIDEGAALLKHLLSQPEALSHRLEEYRQDGWYVRFSQTYELEDLAGVVRLSDATAADPGPFRGEVDAFNLGHEAAQEALDTVRAILGNEAARIEAGDGADTPTTHVFDTAKELKEFIKDLSGIRVYRDGFGVRVDYDWLGLASERTTGKSYYSLRPANTLGYIAISARNNPNLVEKTDREGFQHSPHYENFGLLLGRFIELSNVVHSFLRRGWVQFDHMCDSVSASSVTVATPKQVAKQIADTMQNAETFRTPLRNVASALSSEVGATKESFRAVLGAMRRTTVDPRARDSVQRLGAAVDALSARVEEARQALEELDRYLASVAESNPLSSVLANEISGMQERLDEVYSMVGLGLTAEALSHELHNVTDQIAERTRSAIGRIRRAKQLDTQLLTYAEFVHSAVSAIRLQLSHLAPSLKYVRERREQITIATFLAELAEFHRTRLADDSIEMRVNSSAARAFQIEINRGKLTQVFDNLIINSQYWLREELRARRIKKGLITVEVQRPFVRLFDNGRGISTTVEHRLFNPFVTAKKAGEGRGLGLFITRQLLESDGCVIRVLPERNKKGHLYIFEIDFSGVLHG